MHPIALRGARTHNLKGVDLDVDASTLLVVCGPSGAGKSSLAFGTLYAEGQRRYVESFSAYARQFLERLQRPPVDALEHVPAAIAVDRASPVKSSRSTVGTLTEIADYVKHLWASAAVLDCTACGAPVREHGARSAAEALIEAAGERRLVITYPLPVSDAEHYLGIRERLATEGYRRLWLDGTARDLDEVPPSEVVRGGVARVVADRVAARDRDRVAEALEAAFARGSGEADAFDEAGGAWSFSRGLRCDACGTTYRRPGAGAFSFDSPIGACETCRGFGRTLGVDWDRVFPDRRKTLAHGAIKPWSGKAASWERRLLRRHCQRHGIPMDVPLEQLGEDVINGLVEGDGGNWRNGFPGLKRWFAWLESRAYKMHVRVMLARYRSYETCTACNGTRFKPEVLGWKVAGRSLPELYALPIAEARDVLAARRDEGAADAAHKRLLDECVQRLDVLCDVGLAYLTLDRGARTLSGGELQRVALTSALGSGLTGTLFVLDEPTAGLHPSDAGRLVRVVRRLSESDNVVVVVESDESFVRGADRIVELGPGGGEAGGGIVFEGEPAVLLEGETATARALRMRGAPERAPRSVRGEVVLRGARGHNLRGIDLRVPLGRTTCVTGASGSGKSSLVLQTLVPALQRRAGDATASALAHDGLDVEGPLGPLVVVDQAPLGRTGRGNPATYAGAWEHIRKRLAATPLARERGYGPGTFSFNVPGGRCEACKGEGSETVEMQFLADVHFSCPQCGGKRFTGPALDIELEGHNASDLLAMTIDEAIEQLAPHAKVVAALQSLADVGLGYLRLGQSLNTLSGGEAQRLRLAAALGEAQPDALIVLDEPTAGLHGLDVVPLLACLDRLVDNGATVLVIEHDMRVAAHADHVIDLGPGAGADGGRIVAQGPPAEIATARGSVTAPWLRDALGQSAAVEVKRAPRSRADAQAPTIAVTGAREHNLKNVSIEIPREKLVVVTGPSGSGKTTLAFDVVFAEAQRRYLETLAPYVRQYLKQLPRPSVERVTGMPPGVALDQRQTSGGANSTVATATEVAHHLRLLFARAGTLHCPTCDVPIAPRSLAAIVKDLRRRLRKRRIQVLAPAVHARKGHHRDLLDRARREGVSRARIDGKWRTLTPGLGLDRYKEHDVALLMGSVDTSAKTLEPLLERALAWGQGAVHVRVGREELMLSTRRACASCGKGYPELDPRFFSFNTRQGACERCEGTGRVEDKRKRGRKKHDVAWRTCPTCDGKRLAGLALHTTLGGLHIVDVLGLSVERAHARLGKVKLVDRERKLGERALHEAVVRLGFLERVGLGYLGLDRPTRSLSGGELQRVRLAAQLGSGLTGVLYVLDEPTIGLHARDTGRLLAALRELVEQGCSAVVVEHDADTIRAADHVIDMGPGGGRLGGNVVAQGALDDLTQQASSPTGRAIARPLRIEAPRRLAKKVQWLELHGASEHNLRVKKLRVPLGRLVAVTGVSGSGKSTLVRTTLLRALRQELGLSTDEPGAYESLEGIDALTRAVEIDQTPIGRTPRSVPATYVGIWDEIRRLYAQTPEARARGYSASRFSFNVAQGRCAACEGQGSIKVEMAFLPDAHVPCEECGGSRFDPSTCVAKLHGIDVGALLAMHVDEALALLHAFPRIVRPLELLSRLGLGYLALGQPSNSLSGGEAQRLKLVTELAATTSGTTLYVMDEPTTGLHRDDVDRLLDVLHTLVDRGDTVVVIEHQPDVIAAADWIVDLGPEGGEKGGRIVTTGTPQDLARKGRGHTAKMLRDG